MNNKFAYGVQTNGGSAAAPSHTFIADSTSGMFLSGGKLGFSAQSTVPLVLEKSNANFPYNLSITQNAGTNKVLTSDQRGNATWKPLPLQSSTTTWNSVYSTANPASNINNELQVTFQTPFEQPPNVIFSKEADQETDSIHFYIKNKTQNGFTLYSDNYIYKALVATQIGEYSVCRLANNRIGVAYYDVTNDCTSYIYSLDSQGKYFSTPIVISDNSSVGSVSMTLVNGFPAIVYIYDNAPDDEWHYVRANDINGASWGDAVVVMTATTGTAFLPIGLFLRVVNNLPVVFTNNQAGAAVQIVASDEDGSSWGQPTQISNLVNHQILSFMMVQGQPALVARSNDVRNIYYARFNGSSWPIGAIQLFKRDEQNNIVGFSTNIGERTCDIAVINGILCIVVQEAESNSLYIAAAFNSVGSQWGALQFLTTTNTTNPFPRFLTANGRFYLMYNSYSGSPSQKDLLEFQGINPLQYVVTRNIIASLNLCLDHRSLPNEDDNNSIIILAANGGLSALQFYGNDLKINWLATL